MRLVHKSACVHVRLCASSFINEYRHISFDTGVSYWHVLKRIDTDVGHILIILRREKFLWREARENDCEETGEVYSTFKEPWAGYVITSCSLADHHCRWQCALWSIILPPDRPVCVKRSLLNHYHSYAALSQNFRAISPAFICKLG